MVGVRATRVSPVTVNRPSSPRDAVLAPIWRCVPLDNHHTHTHTPIQPLLTVDHTTFPQKINTRQRLAHTFNNKNNNMYVYIHPENIFDSIGYALVSIRHYPSTSRGRDYSDVKNSPPEHHLLDLAVVTPSAVR